MNLIWPILYHRASFFQSFETTCFAGRAKLAITKTGVGPLHYIWSQNVIHNWAMSWENLLTAYANNKGADQPVHPRSILIILMVAVSYLYFLHLWQKWHNYRFFFFCVCGWVGVGGGGRFTTRQDYFTHFEPILLILSRAIAPRKHTWPASRTWLVPHVTWARLEPTVVRWRVIQSDKD